MRSDHDPAADFSRYQTYNFVLQPGKDKLGSRRLTRQFAIAIADEMQKRGYRREWYYPDLLVNFAARLESSEAAAGNVVTYEYYDYRYYGAWPGYAHAEEEIEMVEYPPGTVNVDLIDRSRMQLVWEGVAFGELPGGRERDRAAITQAIDEIFGQFPFRAGER